MADDYDVDVDDVLGLDDDWLYVEDEFLLPDELAESQLPDPGYCGTNYEIELETHDYDLYMFWDDHEYGYDEYWDYGGIGVRTETTSTGRKRKKPAVKNTASAKRRKITDSEMNALDKVADAYDNVNYMSRREREQRSQNLVPVLEGNSKFAFLPDWRTRFANKLIVTANTMPTDMERAAQALDDDGAVYGQTGGDSSHSEGSGEALEDEGEAGLGQLDSEVVRGMLLERLREAGLGGVEDKAFTETINRMLSGGDHAEDAMEELTKVLLDQASHPEGAVSKWLSQQGVTVQSVTVDAAGETGEDLSAEAMSKALNRGEDAARGSPPDSAISLEKLAIGRNSRTPGQGVAGPFSSSNRPAQPGAASSGIDSHSSSRLPRKRKVQTTSVDEGDTQPAVKRTRGAASSGRKS